MIHKKHTKPQVGFPSFGEKPMSYDLSLIMGSRGLEGGHWWAKR